MQTAGTQAFWEEYRRFEGVNATTYALTSFKTERAVANRLIDMVAAGAKRACAGPMHYFGEDREEPLPVVGEFTVVLDPNQCPHLIWRTTDVAVAPLSSVLDSYLWLDGEGDGSREAWLGLMRVSFSAQARRKRFEMHDDIDTMFETFEVVWPRCVAERARLLDAHFRRGLDLLRDTQQSRSYQQDLEAVLARIETAVLILGPGMLLRHANPAGEALLRQEDALRLRQGAVIARHGEDGKALESAIAASKAKLTLAGNDLPTGFPGFLVKLGRNADDLPYQITAFPLPRVSALALSKAELVLFISNPGGANQFELGEEQLYRKIYRLTPAEAKLAVRLASGTSLDQAAEDLQVTRNTARAQLRALFDKTEARRQAELVRMLSAARTVRLSLR